MTSKKNDLFIPPETTKPTYIKLDHSDKKYKPLILKWLCKQFGYNDYVHNYADQWIRWSVWDGDLSISFDERQAHQRALRSLIPERLMGCPQSGTLKIVNTDSVYVPIKSILHIDYPTIVTSKLKDKSKRNYDGDEWYVYMWEVFLSDNTSFIHSNQKNQMDIKFRDFTYDAIIQERAFVRFLEQFH
jgi:hypothetical protein